VEENGKHAENMRGDLKDSGNEWENGRGVSVPKPP
jgi:hypothetical protein